MHTLAKQYGCLPHQIRHVPYGDFAFDLLVLERGLQFEADVQQKNTDEFEANLERNRLRTLRETGALPPVKWADLPEVI